MWAKRNLKHTGARPVDGAGRGGGKAPKGGAGVFPETWNLKPGTEANSRTDGDGPQAGAVGPRGGLGCSDL